jgi:hypothetical protein
MRQGNRGQRQFFAKEALNKPAIHQPSFQRKLNSEKRDSFISQSAPSLNGDQWDQWGQTPLIHWIINIAVSNEAPLAGTVGSNKN